MTTARQFRVERLTPGATWSDWTYSYHPTLMAARAAAGRFLRGEGKYSGINARKGGGPSTARIYQRDRFSRYVRWDLVETYTDAEVTCGKCAQ